MQGPCVSGLVEDAETCSSALRKKLLAVILSNLNELACPCLLSGMNPLRSSEHSDLVLSLD